MKTTHPQPPKKIETPQKEDLTKFDWYHGNLTNKQTNRLLKIRDEGTFLVRKSRGHKGSFVLCSKEKDECERELIHFSTLYNMYFAIKKRIWKETVHEIVDFYKEKGWIDFSMVYESDPEDYLSTN